MSIAIIGGSGLYQMQGVTINEEFDCDTPFGKPSDVILEASIGDQEVLFLPRHARGHKLLPSEINHRANIFALKEMGVQWVIAVSAVGSLKEELRPGDLVLPDQYFDRTKRAMEQTFFGKGIVAHVPFGEPVCTGLRNHLDKSARTVIARNPAFAGKRVTNGGTYVNMEGPAFSTRAESNFHRQFGFDVIGMTSLAEAKLAREAGMCYSALAMVTDYDCWHVSEASVTAEAVMQTVHANLELAQSIIKEAVTTGEPDSKCPCTRSLEGAIMTSPTAIPADVRRKLQVILGNLV